MVKRRPGGTNGRDVRDDVLVPELEAPGDNYRQRDGEICPKGVGVKPYTDLVLS